MTESDEEYEALADRLTDPEGPPLRVGPARMGAAAAAEGRAFLLREYGSDEAIASAIKQGRPRAGDAPRGESPTVRGRISPVDFEAFKRLEVQTGKKQSELVREAVHLLLVQNRLAG